MREKIRIYICYAREDESLLKKLKSHLASLQRSGFIEEIWDKRDISAGTEWKHAIDEHLKKAHVILLLISPDFMASDYCYSVEMKCALERHERNEAYVLPILLRPAHWQEAPFAKLGVLPSDAKPVTRWSSRDTAFFNVAEGIRKVIGEITGIAVPLARLDGSVVNQDIVDDLRKYLKKLVDRFSRLPQYYQSMDLPLDSIRQHVKVSRKRLQEAESRKRGATRPTEYARKDEAVYQQKFEKFYRWRGSELYTQQEQYTAHWLDKDKKSEHDESVIVDWDEMRMLVHRVVILGDPGFGKTWLLQYEGYRVAREQVARLQEKKGALDDIILPIYLRLSLLAEELVKQKKRARGGVDVVEAIVQCVQQVDNLPIRSLWFVRQCIPSSQCLLLLDALDEVKLDHQPTLLEALEQWVEKEETQCRIILTSRIAGYQQAPFPRQKEKQEVPPELELVVFEREQVTHFIEQWFARDPNRGKRLREALDRDPMLSTLVCNPLLLTFFCLLGSRRADLPIYRSDLYERALRSLLEGSWRRRDLQVQDAERLRKKLVVLQEIAWHFANVGDGQWLDTLPGDEVDEVVEHIPAKRRPQTLSNKQSLLWEFSQRDGVLVSAGEASLARTSIPYLFLHRTFHEWLVASYLARLDQEKMLQQVKLHCWFDSDWEEVIVLLAGCLNDPNPLLESLLEEPADIFHHMLFLVARCLTEIDRAKVKPTLEDRVITELLDVLDTWRFAWDRKQAVLLLRKIRDPRVVPALLRAVQGGSNQMSNYDLHRLAIEALGRIDTPQAMDALKRLSQAKDPVGASLASEILERKGLYDYEKACKIVAAALTTGEVRTIKALQMELQDRANRLTYTDVVKVLKQIGSPEAVDVLLQEFHTFEHTLSRQSESDYRAIINALEQIGTQQVVAGLLHAVVLSVTKLGWPRAHQEAVEILSRINNPQAVKTLRAALHEENWYIRWISAKVLAKRGDSALEVINALQEIFRNPNGWGIAASTLAQIPTPLVVEVLLAVLQDQDANVREYALTTLSGIGNSWAGEHWLSVLQEQKVVDILLAALQDQDVYVREGAAFALAKTGDLRAVEHLLPVLQDKTRESWEYRSEVIKVLANLGKDPRVVKALLAELQGDVRVEAARALGQVGDAQIGDLLQQALRNRQQENGDSNFWLLAVAEASLQLGNIEGTEEALMLLIEDGFDMDAAYYLKEGIERILDKMDDPRLVRILEKCLRNWGGAEEYSDSPYGDICKKIEEVLGCIGAPAVESLLTVLQDKQEPIDVRKSAARVLGNIRDTRARDGLIEVLQEEETWGLHRKVVESLGQIGDAQIVLPVLNAFQQALDELSSLYADEYNSYLRWNAENGYMDDGYMDKDEFFRFAREEYQSEAEGRGDWEREEHGGYHFLESSVFALERSAQNYHDLPALYDRLLAALSNEALDDDITNLIYELLLLRLCPRLRRAVGKNWLAWRIRLQKALVGN